MHSLQLFRFVTRNGPPKRISSLDNPEEAFVGKKDGCPAAASSEGGKEPAPGDSMRAWRGIAEPSTPLDVKSNHCYGLPPPPAAHTRGGPAFGLAPPQAPAYAPAMPALESKTELDGLRPSSRPAESV